MEEYVFSFFIVGIFSNIYCRCNLQGTDPTIDDNGVPSTSILRLPFRQHTGWYCLDLGIIFEVHSPSNEVGNHGPWPQSALLFKFAPTRLDRSSADWRGLFNSSSRANSSITSSSRCSGCWNDRRTPSQSTSQFSTAKAHKTICTVAGPQQLVDLRCLYFYYQRNSESIMY
jgi:hypothetical protein